MLKYIAMMQIADITTVMQITFHKSMINETTSLMI